MKSSYEIHSTDNELLAIVISGNAKSEGIEFLTEPSNNFQIGLMTRGPNSPSPTHFHTNLSRTIFGTQEFLWVRRGEMAISIYNHDQTLNTELKLYSGDAILLVTGGHGIVFSEGCEILEVKQGPYQAESDKKLIEGKA